MVTSLLGGLYTSMMQAVWQPFVLSLGAPMTTLGFLESLGGRRGVVTALIQPIGGWASDRVGRKPLLTFATIVGILATSLCVLAATFNDWRLLIPAVTLLGVTMASQPAGSSMTAESAHADKRAMAYSIIMFAWIVPGIFSPSLGGFIADRWGFRTVFLIRIVLESLRLLLIVRFLKETLGQMTREVRLGELKKVMARILIPPPELQGFYWAMAIDIFVWGLGAALLFGLLSKTYGFTPFQLGVMGSCISVTWALSQLPVGRLVDKYGCKPFLVLSEVLGFFVVAGWLLVTSFWAFAALYALFGLVASTWVPAQLALLANSVAEEERGEAMGRLSAFRGLLSFPAPYIGGLLYERFGFRGPILANLIGVIVAVVAILTLVKEPVREGQALCG